MINIDLSFFKPHIIESAGVIIGLIYLFLEYKGSILLWFAGIIMSIIYIYIFYVGKFYADSSIYLYYLGANIYGLWKWKSKKYVQKNIEEKIVFCNIKKKHFLPLLSIFFSLWILVYCILKYLTDSPVPVGDSFTTSLSIIAMWMMSKKQIEHWFLWIVVNLVSCTLYFWKELYGTSILFMIYTIVSVFGYFNWAKKIEKTEKIMF